MPSRQQLIEIIAIQAEIAKLGLDLNATMLLVVDRILPLIGADGAAIELADGEDMVYRAVSGIAASQLGLRVKQAGSLSGQCMLRSEVCYCEDCEEDPRVDLAACHKVGLRSMIVVPLRYNGNRVGVLKAMGAQPHRFAPSDVAVVVLLSEVIAAAMYFATKYSDDALFLKATHDPMTGLANRALFMDRIRHAIAQHQRDKQPAVLLMIDMDGLKRINDTFGHRAGDAVITEFAHRLAACARESDTVARLGGDEFAFILSPIGMPEGLDAMRQRIDTAIAPPFEFEGHVYQLGASIGAAAYPTDASTIEALLEAADNQMYETKRRHRGETTSA